MNTLKTTINYNPYLYKVDNFEFSDDNIRESINNLLQEICDTDKRIIYWIESLINEVSKSGNCKFDLIISRCDAYEADFITELCNTNSIKDKIYALKILEINPFEDEYFQKIDNYLSFCLIDKSSIISNAIEPHRTNIEQLNDITVEIPVIATMSAGKSTFLNAILGTKLLPALHKPTTAVICEIKADKNLDNFAGELVECKEDCVKRCIESDVDLNIKVIKEWNAKGNVLENLKINVQGPIKNIVSENFQLKFIDTPGPNSANHSNHTESTYKYLKDTQQLPIILYVLNATQLTTTDDQSLLQEVKSVLDNNKTDLNRILFILNKIDDYDLKEEPLEVALTETRKYLKDIGIENPKIFPVSSQYALFSQLNDLSEIDENYLSIYRSKFSPTESNKNSYTKILEFASLLSSQKDILRAKLKESNKEADLVHSGLSPILLYIEDYIANQHKRNKYVNLQRIVNDVMDAVVEEAKQKLLLLKKNDKDQKEFTEQNKENIKKLGEKFENLKYNVSNLKNYIKDLDEKISDSTQSLDTKIDKLKYNFQSKKRITITDARKVVTESNSILNNLRWSIKTDMDQLIENEKRNTIQKLKNEFKKAFGYKENLKSQYFNATFTNHINAIQIGESSISKYIVVENKKSENFFKRILGITDKSEFFDLENFYNREIVPYSLKFREIIVSYQNYGRDIIKDTIKDFSLKSDEIFKNTLIKVIKSHDEQIHTSLEKIKNINETENRLLHIIKQTNSNNLKK